MSIVAYASMATKFPPCRPVLRGVGVEFLAALRTDALVSSEVYSRPGSRCKMGKVAVT
jgi:hypothetical protein